MKIRFINFMALMALFLTFSSYKEADKNKTLVQVMMQGLDALHFDPLKMNDDYSHKVYDLYLKRLDPNKKFFVKSDIDGFSKYRDLLDDEIQAGNFEFFEKTNAVIEERTKEAGVYYKELLSKPMEFTKDETYESDAKKILYAADKPALKEAWRKYLKFQVLTRLSDLIDVQEKAKEKSDTSVKVKDMVQMESEARSKILKSHDEWFKRMAQVEKDERQSMFLNCAVNVFDPHTEFFPPKEKENFDIQLSGQLEGIGAQLQEKDGQTKVSSIVAGSASWKQGQLKAGDIIMKVAQGSAEPVDIADMRLDNVVQLVRGKKGTEVRLTVKKPDNSIVVIPIIRDVVVIEETYAQSAVIEKNKKRFGYIKLPIFYADFNRNGGRSCAEDVRKEVDKLKSENVAGIIIDLRNNGGGSLDDVVRMAGIFIDKGPVVQIKSREGAPLVLEDQDGGVVYDGPLAIMVNNNSASASEILAAAMQDYNRAVIVGSNSTFGKGTVQRFFNLDDYVSPEAQSIKPLGSVKITTQKFYRVNGGATQLKGVIPDIIMADPYAYVESGEKDLDYPMKWDEIPKANYVVTNSVNVDRVRKASQDRMNNDATFKLVKEEANKFKRQKDNSSFSLKLDNYRAEQKKLKEENKRYENLSKENPALNVAALKADIKAAGSDTVKVARNKEWFKNIKKDYYIGETLNVVEDLK